MKLISKAEFLYRQPSAPEVQPTDPYYYDLANRIFKECYEGGLANEMPERLKQTLAMTLTGYIQDIISDAGIWRSFIDANRLLYNRTLPFFDISEDYIDYELNPEDINFLVWYVIALNWDGKQLINPLDNEIRDYAMRCYTILDEVYEDAPFPEGYNIAQGLEYTDPDDHKAIAYLGNWLYFHSYLSYPVFTANCRDIIGTLSENEREDIANVNKILEETITSHPSGPLALYTAEWVNLLINGKLPKDKNFNSEAGTINKLYSLFVEASDGKDIRFFDNYEEMNNFFIDALGWEKGVYHLEQIKDCHDFVLMVNPQKGLLVAHDIARCINCSDNKLFDEDYAKLHSAELLTCKGVCPADLLKRALQEGWLTHATFSDQKSHDLMANNSDFIARCFLQLYYRGD